MALPPLPAQLTHAQAPAWLTAAERAVAQAPAGATLTLDAAALRTFDSSALAALLAVRRAVVARGLAWRIEGLPPRLRTLAAVYGVQALLPG
ncbi:STAS domain-containing protein [Tepidimonas sediminis]|uniref:STAS domain-containing protein n=1 Tax=Tepidimonas sediminis TaxID=2588941 RepID=UPI003CCC4F42